MSLRIYSGNEFMPHFVTMTIVEWIDIFTRKEYCEIIIASLEYCHKNKGLKVFEYVIMPNHLHLIVKAAGNIKLSQIISDFKKHTTREILKLLRTDNRKYILNLLSNSFDRKKDYEKQIWQRENCPETISTSHFYKQKVRYIHDNPVRKGLVARPEDWLYSSARNRLVGDNSIITLDDFIAW
jgi:REP element-mobilizing transposase RayT